MKNVRIRRFRYTFPCGRETFSLLGMELLCAAFGEFPIVVWWLKT